MATSPPRDTTNPNLPNQTAANAQGGKYYVQNWTFPSDLFGNVEKYGNGWLMINVNVQTNSERAAAYEEQGFVDLEASEIRRDTNFDARGNISAGQAAGTIVSGGAAAGAIPSLIRAINNGQSFGSAAVNVASGAIRGGAGAAIIAAPIIVAGTARRETRRIANAIQLPMPNDIITGYSMEWGEDSTYLLDAALRAGEAVKNMASIDGIKNAFKAESLNGLAGDAAAAFSLGSQSALGAGGISAATGLAFNPKKEVIFQGVGYRNFTLNYKFYPKNATDNVNLLLILNKLKFHMHPEYKTDGRFTFVYPSEFDLTFYNYDGVENIYVNKIATCVLTNLVVNYTPDGQWVSHADGSPNAVNVTMSFKELSILTKESIDRGF